MFTANLCRFVTCSDTFFFFFFFRKIHWNQHREIFFACRYQMYKCVFYFNATYPDWGFFFFFFCGLPFHLGLFLFGCHCARLVTEKVQFAACPQKGWAKRIWLMRTPSLYIHDYFLESIRETWLIQMVALIEVLSVSAVDFPSFIFQYSSPFLLFYVDLIFVLPIFPRPLSLNRPCSSFILERFNWLDVTDYIRSAPLNSVWVVWERGVWPPVNWRWEVARLWLSSIMDPHENGLMVIWSPVAWRSPRQLSARSSI